MCKQSIQWEANKCSIHTFIKENNEAKPTELIQLTAFLVELFKKISKFSILRSPFTQNSFISIIA